MEIFEFEKVTNKVEMIQFLENSSSLYHKICAWFLKNPLIKFFDLDQVETHHVIPKFLQSQTSRSILVFYNCINVPYSIHMFLHFLRGMEFKYSDDQITIRLASVKLNTGTNLSLKNSLDTMLKIHQNAIEKTNMIQTERKLQQKKLLESAREQRVNKQTDCQKKFFGTKSVWKNKYYPIPHLIIEANSCKDNADLLKILINHTETFFIKNTYYALPKKWNNGYQNWQNYLNQYLFNEKYRNTGPFFGWILVEAHSLFSEVIAKSDHGIGINHSRQRTQKEVLNFLAKNVFWENENYKIQEFFVK